AQDDQFDRLRTLCGPDPQPFHRKRRNRLMTHENASTAHGPAARRSGFVSTMRERPEVPLAIALFIALIGGWELLVRILDVPKIIVPTPSAVFVSLVESLQSPSFLHHFWITFFETIAGFALGASVGLLLGGIIGQF